MNTQGSSLLDINFRLNFIHYFYKYVYYFTEIQEFTQIGSWS